MHSKRGATVTNFALIIGSLAIGVIILMSLQRINVHQSRVLVHNQAREVANEIKTTLTKASAYPSGSKYELTVNTNSPFRFKVKNGKIIVDFDKLNESFTEDLNVPNLYLLPTDFSGRGKIIIYKKGENVLVSNSNKTICNLSDNKCDPGCIILGKCDPACYGPVSNGVCDPYCVDVNGDGVINSEDLDGICDPDCYSNSYKGGVYDPDCVKSGDGICDPDSNMVVDGICDVDCEKADGICDPDCKGVVDPDCPSKGNGVCEPNKGENCKNDAFDCGCKSGYDCIAGCPTKLVDSAGCVKKTSLLKNGQVCNYSCECSSKNCIFKHCCPTGEYFDSSKGQCISYLNDGKCEDEAPFFEKCNTKNDNDCSCSKLSLGECCPDCKNSLSQGCCPKGQEICNGVCKKMPNPKLSEGKKCECNNQCASNLNCTADPKSGEKACCPKDLVWNSKLKKCVQNTCSYPCTPGCKLPSKWDWRNVNGKNYFTPIRNQGYCGGCWAFSTVGALESEYKVQKNCPSCNIDLSEENLIACDYGGTCNGGLPDRAMAQINVNGIVTESCFPFADSDCLSDPTCSRLGSSRTCADKCSDWMKHLYSISAYHQVPQGSADALKRALICHGPLSIASWAWHHAIVLAGYDDSSHNWIIRNSWGPNWGDRGYGYIGYTSQRGQDFLTYAWYVDNVSEVKS